VKKIFYILLLVVMIFSSCSDLFIESDPENNPENNFEIFWREFDRYYSFFMYKEIDWYAQYYKYRPQVTTSTTGEELFTILSSMVDILKDGHVNIYTPHGTYAYEDWWRDYPINYDSEIIKQNYLKNGYRIVGNDIFTYGILNEEIGYIHISSFGGLEDWNLKIDNILENYKNLKGLVIDVRNNGGGSTNYSDHLAPRFADQRRLYAYIQWRNGPNHDDFTEPTEDYVEPSEEWRFTRPVALLTNRLCFSTTEHFVLMMRVFPHVTVIGDVTGGGSGNPILRELPSGWVYRISRWISLTPEKEIYEGIGLEPDILVNISEEDSLIGKDTIMETAIQTLQFLIDSELEENGIGISR
jgi:hypothetical protein